MLAIEELLDDHEVQALRAFIAESVNAFDAGGTTAGWHASKVKDNEQMDDASAQAVIDKVISSMLSNALFQSFARPHRFAKVMVSRYGPGMQYGMHVDDAIIDGARTDLSFTLFLASPETYDGGELVIDQNGVESEVKLTAGSVVIYPSTTLHRVAEVTRGERLVVVGWVRSLVRSAEQREVLFDLDMAIAQARDAAAGHDMLGRLIKTKANLLRMWAEC